ncbi:sugar transporter [Aureobasidium sp. EXF-8845]|nr:sugar transporter [Aureobasidium sp. EXF-8845]KAI4857153.1 sugar transporter [Aureobasidium sp. EXF-8846]
MSYSTDLKNGAVMVENKDKVSTKDDNNLTWLASQATEDDHNLTLMEGLRKYPKACFCSIAVSSAIIMEGYDIVLIYSLFGQPAFAKQFGTYDSATGVHNLSAAWQAGLGNGATVGAIIGAFLNGYLTHKLGYRKVMLISLATMVAFIFVSFFATNLPVLCVGQYPMGCLRNHGSSIRFRALRAYLTVYVNLTWAFGQLIAAGVMSAFSDGTSKWDYKIPFAIQWVWPIPIAILIWFAPESPWHLVRKGQLEAAEVSVARLSSSSDPLDHKKTVAMIVHTNKTEIEVETGTSYLDCFKRTDLRRTEIVCMAFAAQPFCDSSMGGTPTYCAHGATKATSVIVPYSGLPTSISFKMSVGGLGLAALRTIISWKLLHSFGRRTLYLWGLGSLAAILFTVGFISVGASHSKGGNYAQAVMMLLWLFVYYMTVGPICYAIIGETSATRLRNKGGACPITCNVIEPYMISPDAGNWQGKTGYLWGGWSLVFFVWTFFQLPEMKGITYEELDLLFANKAKTRAFKRTKVITLPKEIEIKEVEVKRI